mgnify:FL=1|tara:strand:- start:889 stop:1359 length:471 start_codon:yes stop_codon:yes gene_type:complete
MLVNTRRQLKSGLLLMSIIMASLFSHQSIAKIYKWVDENGKTHYTQSPPPGDTQSEQIKLNSKVDTESAQKQLEDQKNKADDLQSERHKKSEIAQKEKELAAKKEEWCERAKASKASFERPRVNAVNDDGSRRIMGDEERLEGLIKATKEVRDACS